MTVSSQSGPRSSRPSEDLFTTATSALRRLHFKTGRGTTKTTTKATQVPVPKVIVMGSSTASETTINTSTDSSNTMVTTMTATDGSNTEDSLDITEPIDLMNSENCHDNVRLPTQQQVLEPLPPSTPTPITAKQDQHFLFEAEATPKTAYFQAEEQRFTFNQCVRASATEEKSVDRLMEEQIEALKADARRRNSYRAAQNNFDEIEVVATIEGEHHHIKRNYRRKSEFDQRERTTFSKDQTRMKGLDGNSPKLSRLDVSVDLQKEVMASPKLKPKQKKNNKRQHPCNRQKSDKFTYDEKHIAKYRDRARMTPPDLRVDFFSEGPLPSMEKRGSVCLAKCLREAGAAADAAAAAAAATAAPGGAGGATSATAASTASANTSSTMVTSASPINVTANPLESPLHFGRKHPAQATTIVVQQPSVSLDHASVSTILLRNGAEFVSNVGEGVVSAAGANAASSSVSVSGAAAKLCLKKQREEHMKQLLEVSNNLTLEEIHDFEMRYGSPHHSRSQSVKTPRTSGRPNYLCLPQQRSRVASMPNTGVEEEYYRLRHFSITGKGVVNRGDSLKSRRSRSNNSVASSNSSTEQLPSAVSAGGGGGGGGGGCVSGGGGGGGGSARTSASCSLASSRESSTSAPGPLPYRVLMLGGPAVGKSSLVSQFMTSEYLHAYDTSIDDESGEKSVSVLLAGEESELTFIDFATADLSPDSCISKYSDPHAYCVVYSSADRSSLNCAEKILQKLWTTENISTKAVILVANKADLVRSRMVTTEEGKATATAYDCKYIETSVGINHNVDELLVGILTQIRLKLENPEKTRDIFRKRSNSRKNLNRNKSPVSGGDTPIGSAQNSPKKYRGSRTSASLKVRSLLGKVWARDSKSKSCENLHVL